jgi:hypothetical protein
LFDIFSIFIKTYYFIFAIYNLIYILIFQKILYHHIHTIRCVICALQHSSSCHFSQYNSLPIFNNMKWQDQTNMSSDSGTPCDKRDDLTLDPYHSFLIPPLYIIYLKILKQTYNLRLLYWQNLLGCLNIIFLESE